MTVKGWVDFIGEQRVKGWVHSPENPSRSERVTVRINNIDTLEVLACKERHDLTDRHFSFTKKGFAFTLSDFLERPANVIKILHSASGEVIGKDEYLIFSTDHALWRLHYESELIMVRSVFSRERQFFETPLSGAWNQETNYEPIATIALKILGEKSKRLSLLEVEPPSTTFAKALSAGKRLARLGIVEPAFHLHDWHIENHEGLATTPDLLENIEDAGRSWDIVFLPMLHERSGPRFDDILKLVVPALAPSGLIIFDIRFDQAYNRSYLLSDGGRLLRVSTLDEALAEVQAAGLKLVEYTDFSYIEGETDTTRKMLMVTIAANGG